MSKKAAANPSSQAPKAQKLIKMGALRRMDSKSKWAGWYAFCDK